MKPAITEGVYFHLSNDDYHNDPALSHSGMTQILVSWQDYWERSCHNPKRAEYKPTDAMKLGERTGMYLLDRKAFNASYSTAGNYNIKLKHRVGLSTVEMAKIVDAVECVTSVPVGAEHFNDGYAEVSIFWKDPDTDIMLRAKIDYLRTFGAIDFKRIAGLDNYTIGRAVKSQGLDIQQFLYLEGVKAARRMLREGTDEQIAEFARQNDVGLEWLTTFRDDEDLLFRFLFQRSTPPYIWGFRELDPDTVRDGAAAVRQALKVYKESIAKWGLKKPPMGTSEIKTVSPFHIPRRDYDYE